MRTCAQAIHEIYLASSLGLLLFRTVASYMSLELSVVGTSVGYNAFS